MAPRSSRQGTDLDLCTLLEPQRRSTGSTSTSCDPREPDLCCIVEPEPASYAAMVRRIQQRLGREEERAGREHTAGDALFDELLSLPANRREEAVTLDDRFASYALGDRLADAAEVSRDESPEDAAEMAQLSLCVAERLDAERWGTALVADLKARAWAIAGSAWCSNGAPDAGRAAFRLARSHLKRGSGDPLEEAEVLYQESALLDPSDRTDLSHGLDRAAAIFLEHGERQRLGDSLARKGALAAGTGDHPTAIHLLREAWHSMDDQTPPRRRATVSWLLARSLLAYGANDESWTEIGRARSLLRGNPDALLEARLRVLEGRVAQRTGLDQDAVACLAEGRDALLELGEAEEAARAHLILAELGPGDDGSFATGTRRLLASGGLSGETSLALLLVERAADSGPVDPGLVKALDQFLDRAS